MGSHGNYQRDTYQPYSQNYKEVSMREGDMVMEKMKMMMMMMKMKKMMDERRHGDMDMDDYKKHDDMSAMFRSGYKKNTMDKYEQPQDDCSSMESMFRSMGKMRFK